MPNTRVDVPPSPLPPDAPAIPFSISSIHKMLGEIASAVFNAKRMFDSEEPTTPWKILPISSLNRGIFQADDTHFAVKDFPHPGTPVKSTPLGGVTPNCFASTSKQ